MKRPESYREYLDLYLSIFPCNTNCIACGEAFSPNNTHTKDGWKETQISSMCEDCFDLICEEGENNE